MEIPIEKFNKIKEEAEALYKSLEDIYCPYLQDSVAFNAKGLDHIKFKEWNRTRPVAEQYM